jgi:hypothetical protein
VGKKYEPAVVDPILRPDILLWWDFSDADTLYKDAGITKVSADGDFIYQINDKSGKGNNGSQVSSSYQPIYKTNIQNGKSVGRFDNDYLSFSNRLTTIRTAYFVFSDTENGVTGLKRFLLGDSSTYHWHRSQDANYSKRPYFDAVYNYASPNLRNGAVYRNNISVSPTADYPLSTIHLTTVVATGDVAANSFQKDRRSANSNWIGDLAELILYSTSHDDNTRTTIQNFLNQKWNLY